MAGVGREGDTVSRVRGSQGARVSSFKGRERERGTEQGNTEVERRADRDPVTMGVERRRDRDAGTNEVEERNSSHRKNMNVIHHDYHVLALGGHFEWEAASYLAEGLTDLAHSKQRDESD